MIVKPMVRNHICLSAHPLGCEAETRRQIEYVKARREEYARLEDKPGTVLVIGASGGYGLSSRIAAAFGCGSATVGISFEKGPSGNKTATPGWYNNRTFDAAARGMGLEAVTIDIDAFSGEAKEVAIEAARRLGAKYDLVVYSLASPVRTDPATGILHRSVIKPIGASFSGTTVDVFTGRFSEVTVEPANTEETAATIKVMGGEDWRLWIEALARAGVLASGAVTLAYSYIGPELSWPIYRDGTLGRAKADLDATAKLLNLSGSVPGLKAYVSVNKAVVTRASAVIPIIPLYVSVLFRVMKRRGCHEDCTAQMDRLFREKLYCRGPVPTDALGRIRLDDKEMEEGVQAEVGEIMSRITQDTAADLADIEGFKADFLAAHGFGIPGVDYGANIEP
jgi:enoyl-[acyl-carrier protein] reductase/trans-2-enoyl-CoA reductase (NAD+)